MAIKLQELEKLSIADLWAIAQYLREEVVFWEKIHDGETPQDRKDNEQTAGERQLYLDWIEEILSRKVFYFDN